MRIDYEKIHVGDELRLHFGAGRSTAVKVVRVTKNRVVVSDGEKFKKGEKWKTETYFRKRDGFQFGPSTINASFLTKTAKKLSHQE